jgi:hypothetical protein
MKLSEIALKAYDSIKIDHEGQQLEISLKPYKGSTLEEIKEQIENDGRKMATFQELSSFVWAIINNKYTSTKNIRLEDVFNLKQPYEGKESPGSDQKYYYTSQYFIGPNVAIPNPVTQKLELQTIEQETPKIKKNKETSRGDYYCNTLLPEKLLQQIESQKENKSEKLCSNWFRLDEGKTYIPIIGTYASKFNEWKPEYTHNYCDDWGRDRSSSWGGPEMHTSETKIKIELVEKDNQLYNPNEEQIIKKQLQGLAIIVK